MSMLAERKRKTKWVINLTKKPLWTTDSSGIKFGKELMEKMGWTTGKGLGANEQGIQEPLKVSYKNDTKGMGYKGNDDDWIEQQEEFNELLNQLRNDNISSNIKISNEENITKSLEEKSKLSKARVHYQKFTRGKDLSRYSDHDLACILGTNKIKKEKSKSEEIQTEPKVIGNCETSFGVTTINSGSIQDYFKKKFNNSFNKCKDGTEISNEIDPKRESCFVKSECNLVLDSDEEKFKKRKHKSNFESLNINENRTFESSELENFKSIVKNKKKKRELQEIDLEEVKIKKRRKNCDDSNVFANENSERENHLMNSSNCEESKSLVNKIDNSNSEKKRRKEKNQVELDNGNVAENKKEVNYKNSCISEVSCAEKSRINVEFALEEETIERKKSKKPKKEKLKEINELKNEDCHVSATPLRSQNSCTVTELCSEIESVTKKKKKEKKEKYLKNEDIKSKDSNCHENESFNNHSEKKIIGITETDEALDINNTKKKKKKKSKKGKSEKEKESNNCYTESLEKSNLEEDLRKKSFSTSEQENTQDIQSVRKKKKKKSKEEKLNQIEEADLEFGCDQLTESILKKTSKETNISQRPFNAIEQENIVESESYHKKRKKKYKKEEEKEIENINFCANHGVEMQMQENVLELDFKEKKKRKKGKLDEKVKSKMQFSCNHTEKPILEEIFEKINNNVNIDSTKTESSKKEEEINNEKEKSVENKVKLPEKIEELSRKTFDEKIKLSNNKKNNFHSMMKNEMDEGTGVHKHKIELLNEKRADKFYPGHHTNKRVLRLISLSNLAGFKGSNLNSVVGYGFMPKCETNKSK